MRLTLTAAALTLALCGAVFAQGYDDPAALLEAFYEPYFSGEFADDESQFRSDALQALYDNDAALAGEGEMGALSFDPYIDGQDFELTEFAIGTPVIAGDLATVEVTFENFGEPRALTFDLVQEDDGWKIDDVASTSPDNAYRLTEIFAGAAADY